MLIEAVVISHLSTVLHTNHVYAERPNNPPDEFYLIEKTGASETNQIQSATIAVQSISKRSLLNAAQMSKAAERAMKQLVRVADIGKCRKNSAYNYSDTSTREYRYQAVFDITYTEGE